MRAPLASATLIAVLAISLPACSSQTASPEPTTTTSSATDSASPSPADDVQVIEVTVKDGKVTPNGQRVAVQVGKPIQIRVTADSDGDIHVHSSPEHELEYTKGVTTLEFTIDVPGIVTVEDHTTESVVVQLEAR